MRVKREYRTSSEESYKSFRKANPLIKVKFTDWKNIIYLFNESFKEHILETGEKIKLPFGFGEFSINKKKRARIRIADDGKEYINLPIDWPKTIEKGKRIYNFNYHTEGYFFGWIWFRDTARFKFPKLWQFKPCRSTSRLLCHYLNIDQKYQHIYQEWTTEQFVAKNLI